MVVNARHMRAVPGRKTDVKDAEWIADLLQHSFIPDRPQRELRELTRYRRSLIEERSREANRIQKLLEGANIKLSSVPPMCLASPAGPCCPSGPTGQGPAQGETGRTPSNQRESGILTADL